MERRVSSLMDDRHTVTASPQKVSDIQVMEIEASTTEEISIVQKEDIEWVPATTIINKETINKEINDEIINKETIDEEESDQVEFEDELPLEEFEPTVGNSNEISSDDAQYEPHVIEPLSPGSQVREITEGTAVVSPSTTRPF